MGTDVCLGRARPPWDAAGHGLWALLTLRAGGCVPHTGSGARQCWHRAALGAPRRACAFWTRSVPGKLSVGCVPPTALSSAQSASCELVFSREDLRWEPHVPVVSSCHF